MAEAGLFSGVRIVELAFYIFVPGAATLLADQGAEVIKVEAVGTGDPYRTVVIGDGREFNNTNLAMEQNNRGKRSIALDLRSPEGRAIFLDLIRNADVFMTGLRPKSLTSLGLDVEDLRKVNPKLIYARGNGYGFRGPEADRPGFDASAFYARGCIANLLTTPGQPMTPPRVAMGDHISSLSLAYAVAGALFRRAATGEPTVVESSLLATALWAVSGDITFAQQKGYQTHNKNADRFPLMSDYRTKDGVQILLMLLNPQPHWPKFCKMMGREDLIDDPKFAENKVRIENGAELRTIFAGIFASRTWAEWKPVFDDFDAPWEVLRTVYDVRDDPQATANEMIYDIELPSGEELMLVSGPISVNGRPMAGAPRLAPDMGQHTEEVLRDIGYPPERIADLKERRLVQ